MMGLIHDTVYYCCVWKANRILYAYSGGDHDIENMAAFCLERTPPYHKWYFQTTGKKIFGFLMEDGYVYFAIVDEGLGNHGVLKFLEHVKEEYKRLAKKGCNRSLSNLNTICLQEQLVPVIRHLISSLEKVSQTGTNWPAESPSPHHAGLCPSPCDGANGQTQIGASTKLPLLGKSTKLDKKKMKDHVIAMRDIELEEDRKSTDRGLKADTVTMESTNNHGAAVSPISLQKDMGSMRIRSNGQNIRKKWCRQVRIILAIDAVVCLVLLVVWLVLCRGTECLH